MDPLISTSICRCGMMGLAYCDAGPSTGEASKTSKAKLGFENCEEWRSVCGYEQRFRPTGEVPAVSSIPEVRRVVERAAPAPT